MTLLEHVVYKASKQELFVEVKKETLKNIRIPNDLLKNTFFEKYILKEIPKRETSKTICITPKRLIKKAILYIRGEYGFRQVEKVIEEIYNKNRTKFLDNYIFNVSLLLQVPQSQIERAKIKDLSKHFENLFSDKSFCVFDYRNTFQFVKLNQDVKLTETVHLFRDRPFEIITNIFFYPGNLYEPSWEIKSLIGIEKRRVCYSLEIVMNNVGTILISDLTRFL